MDNTLDLKSTVLEYVKSADIRLLKMFKALAETYQNDELGVTLSKEQYKTIDARREAHLNGLSNSFTWEQVKENVKNART